MLRQKLASIIADICNLLQAALAAAQQGGGSFPKPQSSATMPQVPRPPISAGLGLDLSSLRLQTSSPTPQPQRVRHLTPLALAALPRESCPMPYLFA